MISPSYAQALLEADPRRLCQDELAVELQSHLAATLPCEPVTVLSLYRGEEVPVFPAVRLPDGRYLDSLGSWTEEGLLAVRAGTSVAPTKSLFEDAEFLPSTNETVLRVAAVLAERLAG